MIGIKSPCLATCVVRTATASLLAALIVHGFIAVAAAAQEPPHEPSPHVRVQDRQLTGLWERGMTGSATFRSLMTRLSTAPVVVYVDCDWMLPTRVSARLTFISSAGGWRYMKARIDCRMPQRRQLSMLAHELQHALEIADTPDVVDAASMEGLYRDIGYETYQSDRGLLFETDAAVEVQRRVELELADRPAPPAEHGCVGHALDSREEACAPH